MHFVLSFAHELAKWFEIDVRGNSDFEPTPFKPLPKPADAQRELEEEINFLREEVARSQLAADASEAEIKDLSKRLDREAIAYQESLDRISKRAYSRESELARLLTESSRRLKEVVSVANSKPFQSFLERGKKASQRLGRNDEGGLSLTQLRITTGETSSCCNAPMIVVQSMKGGFISKNCLKCNIASSLRMPEFLSLQVCVVCGDCGKQAEPTKIWRNYGYRCQMWLGM